MIDTHDRHPATQQIARWFAYDHLPAGSPRAASRACAELAEQMIDDLPDGPELTAGLRKLLEAKDCFVRAAIQHAPDADEARHQAQMAEEEREHPF